MKWADQFRIIRGKFLYHAQRRLNCSHRVPTLPGLPRTACEPAVRLRPLTKTLETCPLSVPVQHIRKTVARASASARITIQNASVNQVGNVSQSSVVGTPSNPRPSRSRQITLKAVEQSINHVAPSGVEGHMLVNVHSSHHLRILYQSFDA